MANPSLHEEILFEIFLRLPAKSVGKCRCLSKKWHTQLSTKQFIDSHLTLTKKTQKGIEEKQLIVIYSESLHIVNIPLQNDEDEVVRSRAVQLRTNKWSLILGSCNGLVLLLDEEQHCINCTMFVVNPITRQQVKIPDPCSPTDHIYGFGYDPFSDDYKVVIISYFCGDISENENERGTLVDVYSLKRKVWKRVAIFPPDPMPLVLTMPFVNGAVHWLTLDNTYRIDAFDLATERFHQVPFPKGFRPEFLNDALVVVKGCLGVVDGFDVWVMKEYGVVDSWVRYRFDVDTMGIEMKPVCFIGNKSILYVTNDDRECLVACDSKKEFIICGLGNTKWSVFVESLVSPEQEDVVSS